MKPGPAKRFDAAIIVAREHHRCRRLAILAANPPQLAHNLLSKTVSLGGQHKTGAILQAKLDRRLKLATGADMLLDFISVLNQSLTNHPP